MIDISAKDWVKHEDGSYSVRCPLNGAWASVSDVHPEGDAPFPLVGVASYEESLEHWIDTGETFVNNLGETCPLMKKVARENAISWNEEVRLLEAVPEPEPEGGRLHIGVAEEIGVAQGLR